ncbi:hypothetical protein QFC19_002633 [Naganishia cerealis]|uniref:Uncharacterized protein n=1 Tax=Naganishia cerealis TaxID=610337 RepID=A0ACC2W7Y3_9TREE|nr:hypothetical protein QFC19_002633 [Naganishia cerealis]
MEPDHENAYYEAEGLHPEDEEYNAERTSPQTWFTTLPGHDYYCEVEETYIEDDFNLTGLSAQVPFWKEALEMVLDVEPGTSIPAYTNERHSADQTLHQRYIITKAGLQAMAEKYESGSFGVCPRYNCQSTYVLPCGRSDQPGLDTVKLYCPNCNDIYTPPSSKYQNVDGAFFGTSFPTLFFQTYPEFLSVPFKWYDNPTAAASSTSDNNPSNEPPSSMPTDAYKNTISFPKSPNPHGGTRQPVGKVYEPRIYGFRVSERARSGPRMGWLRDRPVTYDELDKVDWKGRWIGDGPSAGGVSVSSGGGKATEGPAMGGVAGIAERPKVGKGKLFEEEELKENDEEDVSEEEEVKGGATPAS